MNKLSQKKWKVEKPWGNFEQFTENELVTVKILTVKPQESLSLQYHHKREEFWKVLSGRGEIRIGDSVFAGKEGDEYFIGRGQKHRLSTKKEEIKILEISFGDFEETDIVRLKDKYNRHKSARRKKG